MQLVGNFVRRLVVDIFRVLTSPGSNFKMLSKLPSEIEIWETETTFPNIFLLCLHMKNSY